MPSIWWYLNNLLGLLLWTFYCLVYITTYFGDRQLSYLIIQNSQFNILLYWYHVFHLSFLINPRGSMIVRKYLKLNQLSLAEVPNHPKPKAKNNKHFLLLMGLLVSWVALLAPVGHTNASIESYELGMQLLAAVSPTFWESTRYQNLSRIALVVEAAVQEGTQAFLRPGLGLAHCHIFSILLTKAKHKTSPNSRDGKTDSISWWENFQGLIAKGIDIGICEELEPLCPQSTTLGVVDNLSYPSKSTLHSSIVTELQPATQILFHSLFLQLYVAWVTKFLPWTEFSPMQCEQKWCVPLKVSGNVCWEALFHLLISWNLNVATT